jgi:dipeptidyl-peptidase-4
VPKIEDAYALAETLLPWNGPALVLNAVVAPFWPDASSTLCYRRQTKDGWSFVAWDRAGGSRAAFDHALVARGLAAALGAPVDAGRLPFSCFQRVEQGGAIAFNVGVRAFVLRLDDGDARETPPSRSADAVSSPDRAWSASVRDGDVGLRASDQAEVTALTRDAQPHHAYGAWPEANLFELVRRSGQITLPPPIGWSPDSRFFVVHKLDEREVEPLHLLQYVTDGPGGRPLVHSYRYALPADAERPHSQLFVVDTLGGQLTPFDLAPIQGVVLPPIAGLGYWWAEDSAGVLVIRWLQGRNRLELSLVDPVTGKSRLLMAEGGDTPFRANHNFQAAPNIRYLPASHELIWFSERSGWGHLYLYDSESGALKCAITSGDWLVDSLLHVDQDRRRIYFSARGREPGRDPYERCLYRVNFDSSDLTLLTPEVGDHLVHTPAPATMHALGDDETVLQARGFSPTGDLFVESWSRLDQPPITQVRSVEDGTVLAVLEQADASALLAAGWRPPERVRLKGRDGKTDLYATLWAPQNVEPGETYPLLDLNYPGPHVNLAPVAFTAPGPKSYFWPEALAALGFGSVMIDGLGTPFRERSFLDFSYGNLGDAGGLADHAAAFAQLKTRFPWVDTERVGVLGTSAGGFAAARALFQFPEVFKVGVSGCGAHDIRLNHAAWAEICQGVRDDPAEADALYATVSNYDLVDGLQGRLLIVHGDLDENVHPAVSMQLVDRLIKAGKDFDFLLLPGRGHNFRNDPYFVRRTFDYLVRHLTDRTPPRTFTFSIQDRTSRS